MGIGKNNFKSKSHIYETPNHIFKPLQKEFNLSLDVCANEGNHKCKTYFTEKQDALNQNWNMNFWMNPPFGRQLQKFVKKAQEESFKNKVIGVCLLPVRSNTRWWHKHIIDTKAEVRFIRGEVKFVGFERGLWMPFAIVIFKPTLSKNGISGATTELEHIEISREQVDKIKVIVDSKETTIGSLVIYDAVLV